MKIKGLYLEQIREEPARKFGVDIQPHRAMDKCSIEVSQISGHARNSKTIVDGCLRMRSSCTV
jgi:hypothetical protein